MTTMEISGSPKLPAPDPVGSNSPCRLPTIRLVLAEDQQMVRSALISLIELEEDIEVVGQAGRGDEAVALALRLRPDVVVLDIDMPGMDGISAAAALADQLPECRTLVLTAMSRPGALQRALQAKARGFVVKHAPADQLLDAIRTVAGGGRVVDPSLAIAALTTDDGAQPTSRERDVVRLLADGHTARDIAAQLFLSEGTVRNYTSNVMAKCGARNRVDLVRLARQRGWV